YYVWFYSSKDMPVLYKIAAVLAGQQGTFMFWTWLGSIFVLWLPGKKTQYALRTLLISEFVVVLLFLLTLLSEPFKLVSQFPLLTGASITDGTGIDPELLSPWMVIHPPITFVAYAAMTLPFAAGITHLLWNKDMEIFAQRWAQVSWLFFSLGIGLVGGVWTYEAGWGIWTWDASEAGSLIPWLLLTAGLHLKKHQSFQALLFVTVFISILFTTFIIRSGFWGSVHEFAETSVSLVLGAVIIIAVLGTIYLIYSNRKKLRMGMSVDAITPAVMVLLAAIVFVGLSIPLFTKISGDEASVGQEFYNLTTYPFVLLLLILLGVCMLGKKGKIPCVVTVVLTIALAFFKPSNDYLLASPSSDFFLQSSTLTKAYGSLSLLSLIPPVVFALFAIFYRLRRQPKGVSFIHIGALLLFFGGVYATSFSSEYSMVFSFEDIGEIRSAGNYKIQLIKVHIDQNERGNWVQSLTVEIWEKENSLGEKTMSFIRDRTGDYATGGILRRPFADIFITFQGLELVKYSPPVIPLHVNIYPFLNIFWLGDILLSLGIILLIWKKK
ncbi:MAG TPA: cytochrome c biogenesis protein CcsA, partial [Candidatus Methylomirabilis sp.]|nr:cytochrome c biogenesis protein CcsA [Candidatus Methylomirabilis sp.]